MTQIRDHALRAAPEVHAVDVDANPHCAPRDRLSLEATLK
jgi:hypothetical protein